MESEKAENKLKEANWRDKGGSRSWNTKFETGSFLAIILYSHLHTLFLES